MKPGLDRMSSFVLAVFGLSLIFAKPASAVIGGQAPEISNPVWLNSHPLQLSNLRGKVVMVEFWTFGCYNCRNIEPYVKAWHQKYVDQGLVVIAVHSPEFSYEAEVEQVQAYIREKSLPTPCPSIMIS